MAETRTEPEDLARYQLLASAIAACSVRVERAAPGESSTTDGDTIFLAHGSGDQQDVDSLLVQTALLAAGSLDRAIVKRLTGRPGVARRYLAVEGWRALAELADILPATPLAQQVRTAELLSDSPEESLRVATSRRSIPEPPDAFGVLRPRRLLANSDTGAGAPTPQDVARQTIAEDLLPDFDEDEEAESLGALAKLLESPFASALSQWLAKKAGAGREPGEGSAGGELPMGGARLVAQGGSRAALSMLPVTLLPTEVLTERGPGWTYPEWDSERRRYRQEWCTVTEVDPRPENLKAFDPPPASDLRRRLARLGVGLERHRQQLQGDDLDLDAVVDARVGVAAGSTPDEAVYIESQRTRRSLAVLLLLDVSGSAAEQGPASRKVHECQQAAASVLLEALGELGDRVALYGFRSRGRTAVRLIRVKAFGDTLDGRVFERLGGLVPGSYTRLGAAIRHGAFMLDTRSGTDRRLLVVLSDGFAYDDGYEGPYAEADARRALAETRRQGIGCLCLSLGAATDREALSRVFGTAAHASARRFEDLMPSIGPLFQRAMASADLHRRLAQRHRRSEPTNIPGG